jgi:SAM-dependent methyltransferase
MEGPTDIARAWSAVAPAWDANVDDVDEHSLAATAALLEQLAVQPGDRVLELAAGPGSLAPTWAQLVGPTGSVVLSDIAPGMVEIARRRSEGLENVQTAVIDAAAIDRPDGSFDVVTCRMGLMFTPDPSAALAEMQRGLVPGGRVGALTWGGMEHNPWMTCVGMAAMANGIVSGGPPISRGGIFSLGDPSELERLAKGAGVVDVVVEEIAVTFRAPSVDAHIDRVAALAGPLADALEAATPEQLDGLRRTARELAAPYLTDDGVAMPGRALLVAGRR